MYTRSDEGLALETSAIVPITASITLINTQLMHQFVFRRPTKLPSFLYSWYYTVQCALFIKRMSKWHFQPQGAHTQYWKKKMPKKRAQTVKSSTRSDTLGVGSLCFPQASSSAQNEPSKSTAPAASVFCYDKINKATSFFIRVVLVTWALGCGIGSAADSMHWVLLIREPW